MERMRESMVRRVVKTAAKLGLILGAVLMGACSTGVFIQKDPMKDKLAAFSPGTHSRTEVVALLGEPLVHMPERGVDVFQREGELVDMLLPGIPYTTDWNYYTIISYDSDGMLTGIDSGGYVYRSVLEAERFQFRMGYPGTLVERELQPAYATPGAGCTLVMLTVGNRWSDKPYYQDPVMLNDETLPWHADYSSYLYVSTAPGPQSLAVTWGTRRGPESSSRTFDCGNAEIVYVTLTDDLDGEPIAIGREFPTELQGRSLVLYPPATQAPLLPAR